MDSAILTIKDIKSLIMKSDALCTDAVVDVMKAMLNRLDVQLYEIVKADGIEKKQQVYKSDKAEIVRQTTIKSQANTKLEALIASIVRHKVNEEYTLADIRFDRFGRFIIGNIVADYVIKVNDEDIKHSIAWVFDSTENMKKKCRIIIGTDEMLALITKESIESISESVSMRKISQIYENNTELNKDDAYSDIMTLSELSDKIQEALKGGKSI